MLTEVLDGLHLVWRNDHCFWAFVCFSPSNVQYQFLETLIKDKAYSDHNDRIFLNDTFIHGVLKEL